MFDIDYVMDLLDWNNSAEKQMQGIKLAREIKCINVFLQPGLPYGKSVWNNCAKILSERTNEELSPYLIDLMEWLQDMNWPGAFDIYARIKRMNVDCIMENYIYAIKIALKYQDINWLDYLSGLIENPEVYKLLPEEYQKLMTKYYNDFWKE